MKLTPLFIVRESVSVEVCCCSCCISSFCACICFQKLPKIRTLPDAINARHTHTNTHTYIHIFLCVCKEQKDQTRFRHIRHSMLRFVSCCCCCCLFYHLTIFSECLHPKNNFVEQLFLVGCRSRKITAHILTLSVSPLIHTHRHIQTKSGMHKLWALPSKQKTNKSSLWAHILSLSLRLALLAARSANWQLPMTSHFSIPYFIIIRVQQQQPQQQQQQQHAVILTPSSRTRCKGNGDNTNTHNHTHTCTSQRHITNTNDTREPVNKRLARERVCVRVCVRVWRESVSAARIFARIEREQKESNASSALLLRCLPLPAFVVVVVCIFLPCFRAFNTIQQLHKTVCCV